SLNLVQGRREFDTGLFCAESILTTVAEYYGIQSQLIPVIATGLCSGMGRTCGTCGALTGGILAVNLIYGRKSEYESVEKNYEAVQELVHGFTELFGTTNCAELLGCDIGTEAGQLTFTHKKLHRRCREYTGIAAELSIKAIENIKE
ncbi:MAG: C-GCAxxG-C-C family protein, partial [Bacteroidota bacterium]